MSVYYHNIRAISRFYFVIPLDKRQAAIRIRQALADLPVAKDVFITTPREIQQRGELVSSVLRPALREGKVLYERS
jgi:hypothetical protein